MSSFCKILAISFLIGAPSFAQEGPIWQLSVSLRSGEARCTGVRVGPQSILLSGRCFGAKPAKLGYAIDTEVPAKLREVKAKDYHYILNPRIVKGSAKNDFALVIFKSNVLPAIAIRDALFLPQSPQSARGGESVLMIEMGKANSVASTQTSQSVLREPASTGELSAKVPAPARDLCGDTQFGPMFVYIDETPYLAGVLSRTKKDPDQKCPNHAIGAEITPEAMQWIREEMRKYDPQFAGSAKESAS